jgi:hypothetical protein
VWSIHKINHYLTAKEGGYSPYIALDRSPGDTGQKSLNINKSMHLLGKNRENSNMCSYLQVFNLVPYGEFGQEILYLCSMVSVKNRVNHHYLKWY